MITRFACSVYISSWWSGLLSGWEWSLTMRVVVVRRAVRAPVPLVLVLHDLDDVADGVGEPDIVMVTSVVATPSRTGRSSAKRTTVNTKQLTSIPLPCMLPCYHSCNTEKVGEWKLVLKKIHSVSRICVSWHIPLFTTITLRSIDSSSMTL